MKKAICLFVITFLVSGCGKLSDQEVLFYAKEDYHKLSERYNGIIENFSNDKDLAEAARQIGASYCAGFWDSLFSWDGSLRSDGAPLHKAVFVLSKDSSILTRHINSLEARAISYKPIYENLKALRKILFKTNAIIQADKNYAQESQFLEQKAIAQSQYAESSRQTRLLQEIAERRAY